MADGEAARRALARPEALAAWTAAASRYPDRGFIRHRANEIIALLEGRDNSDAPGMSGKNLTSQTDAAKKRRNAA